MMRRPGLCVNAHEPAINQVGNHQACLVVVARKPGDDVNDVLQLHQVLPGTVLHVGHLCLIRRTRWPFRFNNSGKLLERLVSRPFQVFCREFQLECSQRLIDVMDEHDE